MRFFRFTFFILLSLFLYSCENNDKPKDELNEDINIKKNSKGVVGLIDGKIFCVPSPYRFTNHIKQIGSPYNYSLLNPSNNKPNYESSFKKNVNFGIYGIDLAYINIFEQSADAINYFSVLKSLSKEIGLTEIFDVNTLERLENNIVSQDSLLYILANKYKEADKLLKTEEQKSQAALILAGNWIESLYLLTQIESESSSKIVQEYIAEHIFSANNLLAVLRPYSYSSEEYKELVFKIVDICYLFDGVTYEYKYNPPQTDPKLKKTIITSESKMKIYPIHLELITKKIQELRNMLIN